MKYKVGDKVRVKKDLEVGKRYGDDIFSKGMKKYAGKAMTVGTCIWAGKYRLKEDDDKWNWTDEMLEDVEDITILVKGNKVIAKKDGKVGIAKCSPEDKFDIFVGAKLALERLEEKCKPYGWLKLKCDYWIPDFDSVTLCRYSVWMNNGHDKMMLERGVVFRTREEAIEAAKKMLAVLKEADSNDER